MDMTPQSVRGAQFKTVRKGLDADEVRVFLDQVAAELERAQNHSTAMEARARAAVHRLQEITEAQSVQPTADAPVADAQPTTEQSDAITKTLLLAQRTADSTVADARTEADRLLAEARSEAEVSVANSQATAAQLLEEAREEARAVGEQERRTLESDVSELMARRDFLESDVDHLEKFLDAQRDRLRETASTLVEMAERVPGGLGEVHRPVLSAAADDDGVDESDDDDVDEDDTGEFEPDFSAVAEESADEDAVVNGDASADEDASADAVEPERVADDDAGTQDTPADGFTLRFDEPS